ncbi:hypothetical protein B3C1_17192 [Gallaecimonas xiamenensis 3-C-1]|uniref:Uncharacterized protein n=1 Tax=Gallaecimonas xiamenensis 3-C-1 TaxID=745411 RepID=K2JCD6_9GAMM|nr:hypothetical protein B3C1_17192 [Gallaecimonas xiamenensis 3-C-1]
MLPLLISTATLAAQKVEYKCHLTLEKGKDYIGHFVVSPDKAKALVYSLPYTKLRMAGSPTINQVHECVPANADFKSRKAQKLEREQPR